MNFTFDRVVDSKSRGLSDTRRHHEKNAEHRLRKHNRHTSFVKYQFHKAELTSESHGNWR